MSRAFHDLCFLPQIVVCAIASKFLTFTVLKHAHQALSPDLWLSIQCPAAQLVNPSRQPCRLRFWHDQLFAKPPHHGGVVAWYECYKHFKCPNVANGICFVPGIKTTHIGLGQSRWCILQYVLNVWPIMSMKGAIYSCFQQVHIALDDQIGDRGGLQFIPGSHRYSPLFSTHNALKISLCHLKYNSWSLQYAGPN